MVADGFQGVIEIGRPHQCVDLVLVGNDDLHAFADRFRERRFVPLDAKGIGQRQRDRAARFPGKLHGCFRECRPFRDVPHVAFDQHGLRFAEGLGRDIRDTQFRAGTEIGVHGPLTVRRDHDVAARRRNAIRRGCEPYVDAQRAHVVIEDLAELVVPDAADVCGAPTEIRESGDSVSDGAAGHFGGRAHHLVYLVRAPFVDQVHRSWDDTDPFDELMVDVRQHVDNRVADAEKLDIVGHLTGSPG